ncbi:glutamate racemase [endosymbiont of unidentified scaly snail isolate Monju]|uniref:glutamate racemase n=1 Tax=endosymbiont of unidentified scaly snail isolate Monju TaxID=1248727 RepID=UPI000389206A|nr:aspartate/glutamate racemase family protein [endosymbiont of unidentified scaly snail isolate Monju]BAN70241.1 glutamate racemase [endosymbiont of unidentified scaly snail isolate Monju]
MKGRLRIGIFDSGIGGLSVLRHAVAHLPADYVYVADSRHAPWGEADPDWVRSRSLAIAHHLAAEGVDALAAEAVRAALPVPVVAMEPAIKPAVTRSRSGQIAVLATRSTLHSARYRQLRARFAASVQVHELAPHHWIDALEQGRQDDPAFRARLRRDLAPLVAAGVDTWVLACTHFPLLLPQLRALLGESAVLIDPAPAVTAQLVRVLGWEPSPQPASARVRFRTSGDPAALRAHLTGLGLRGAVTSLAVVETGAADATGDAGHAAVRGKGMSDRSAG